MAVPEFTRALQETDEIDLTVTGRRSGRQTSRPVWFVLEGDTLYLLPVKGSDSEWFKNMVKNATVTLTAEGTPWSGRARAITEPAQVQTVVEEFRAKYGGEEVAKYYSKFDVAAKVPLA